MDNDSIHHTIINNLADGQVEFLGTTGKETGTMSYSIAIMPEDVAVAEDIDIQSGKGLWWIGVALGLALGVFFIVRYILKKQETESRLFFYTETRRTTIFLTVLSLCLKTILPFTPLTADATEKVKALKKFIIPIWQTIFLILLKRRSLNALIFTAFQTAE